MFEQELSPYGKQRTSILTKSKLKNVQLILLANHILQASVYFDSKFWMYAYFNVGFEMIRHLALLRYYFW